MNKQSGQNIIKNIMKDALSVFAASFLASVALHTFILPNGFVSGGIGGIAAILENAGLMKAYISNLLMNIPLLIAALIWLRKDFAVKTISCTVLISVIMGLMDDYHFFRFNDDRLLAAVYSGLLYGIALGIIYERGGSTGGSEIIANLIVKKNPAAKVNILIMMMDVVVIIGGLTVFDGWSVVYAIICSVCCERAMAFYIGRGKAGGMYYVITSKPDAVKAALNEGLNRHGIEIDAKGSYTGNKKSIIKFFMPAGYTGKVKDALDKNDKEAFSFVIAARSISGDNKIK